MKILIFLFGILFSFAQGQNFYYAYDEVENDTPFETDDESLQYKFNPPSYVQQTFVTSPPPLPPPSRQQRYEPQTSSNIQYEPPPPTRPPRRTQERLLISLPKEKVKPIQLEYISLPVGQVPEDVYVPQDSLLAAFRKANQQVKVGVASADSHQIQQLYGVQQTYRQQEEYPVARHISQQPAAVRTQQPFYESPRQSSVRLVERQPSAPQPVQYQQVYDQLYQLQPESIDSPLNYGEEYNYQEPIPQTPQPPPRQSQRRRSKNRVQSVAPVYQPPRASITHQAPAPPPPVSPPRRTTSRRQSAPPQPFPEPRQVPPPQPLPEPRRVPPPQTTYISQTQPRPRLTNQNKPQNLENKPKVRQANIALAALPEDSDGDGIPGVAGVNYPTLHVIPKTSFSCVEQPYNGYYADLETSCQVMHLCQAGGSQSSFLCPNGTIFSQEKFSCQWWYKVDCAAAPRFYVLNDNLYKVPKASDNDDRIK